MNPSLPSSDSQHLLYTRLEEGYLLGGQATFDCHFRDTDFGDQACLRKAKPTESRVGWKVGFADSAPAA